MNIIVFMDLDDSIFQTRRKCGPETELRVGALGPDGSALSFLRPAQALLFERVFADAVVVPVTARNLDSFRRVTLPFRHGAILNFGGLVLGPDGAVDEDWVEQTRPLCRAARERLHEACSVAGEEIQRLGLCCRVRLVSDAGLDFYVVCKNRNGHVEELDRVEALFADRFADLRIHRNGNNLALLPRFLNKARALPHFLERHLAHTGPDRLLLGLGDSLTDKEFMKLCDYLLLPSGSQLEAAL